MKNTKVMWLLVALWVGLLGQPGWSQENSGCESKLAVGEITLPPGFSISVYCDKVPNARGMALSPDGTLFVGTFRKGNVYSVRDNDGDGCGEDVEVIARVFDGAVGLAFRDGDLYFSNYSKIWKIPDAASKPTSKLKPVLISDAFPTEKHHGWKFIRFGPDGKLYVPVGAPCNICDEGDPFASIMRMDPDGKGLEVFARGVRNTVGFDWHPLTGELYFTDNGRDMMGNDIPPDELNRAPKSGMHFGYPYFHGNSIADPKFGEGHRAADYTEPLQTLGPHVAALGMRFYTGDQFPEQYHNQVFIAEHGSWNRDSPLGARVMLVRLDEEGNSLGYEVFAEGWQRDDGSRWGRPVDVLVMPDGSMLVSDDLAGAIYRISFIGDL